MLGTNKCSHRDWKEPILGMGRDPGVVTATPSWHTGDAAWHVEEGIYYMLC